MRANIPTFSSLSSQNKTSPNPTSVTSFVGQREQGLRDAFSTRHLTPLYLTPLTLTLTQQTLTITISIHTPNPRLTMVAPYAAAEAALLMQPPLPYHPPLPFFCQGVLIFVVWNFSHPAVPTLSVLSSGECNISLALTASYDRMEISRFHHPRFVQPDGAGGESGLLGPRSRS